MISGEVIDCDVHQDFRDADEQLFPYLSAGWQEFVLSPRSAGHERISVVPAFAMFTGNPFGAHRKDAHPPEGGKPGSSPRHMLAQLVEPFDLRAAVLTGGPCGLYLSGHSNPYFAAEISRAVNDYMSEQWLAVDSRFLGSGSLALQVPESAAAEIRRVAGLPGMVQVVAAPNPQAYPFGHPIYAPVHRACAETGLPFAIHALGDGTGSVPPAPLAGGLPTLYLEFHSGGAQGLMTHLMSFIFHGVFERFPDFRLVLLEGGIGWLPSLLRRMDANFKGLRREAPWCKKSPSEYFHQHVLVATQPYDIDGSAATTEDFDSLGIPDRLVFASDYPHWDHDAPRVTQTLMPKHWRQRVVHDNAARLYGLHPVAQG